MAKPEGFSRRTVILSVLLACFAGLLEAQGET